MDILANSQNLIKSHTMYCAPVPNLAPAPLSKLDIRLLRRPNVGIIPPNAQNQGNNHKKEIVNVNRPLMAKQVTLLKSVLVRRSLS
jgi:hypothetical protein